MTKAEKKKDKKAKEEFKKNLEKKIQDELGKDILKKITLLPRSLKYLLAI